MRSLGATRATPIAPRLMVAFGLWAGCAGGDPSTGDDAARGPEDAAVLLPPEDASRPPEDLSVSSPVDDLASDRGCAPGMVRIDEFCVDRYEAYLVELRDGGEAPHSPFAVVAGAKVAARVAAGVMPQGYISQVEASAACAAAGKRLCDASEFARACRGALVTGDGGVNDYPYGGTTRVPGACNEGKGSSVARFFGVDPNKWTYGNFNDPRLNQWDGGLAPTGSYPRCRSPYGVYDCVGNLHEWGSDPADLKGHGRFRGGFYGDAEINGKGCLYVTSAHELAYHDYSTGFRCCAEPRP